MKKKLLAVLAAVLIIACAGCSQISDEHDHNHEEPTTAQPIKTYTITGKTDGNKYTNKFADLTFVKPDKWVFLKDDALAALGGNSSTAVCDMAAVEGTTDTSVTLVFTNSITISGDRLTAKQFCETNIKATVSEGDMSTVTAESEVTLGGNKYIKLVINTSDINHPMSITHYVRAIDYYIVDIVATTPVAKVSDTNFEAMFS